MEVAHGGGRRLMKGDASHTVLRGWIAGGMPLDPPTEPRLDRIEIYPQEAGLPGNRQAAAGVPSLVTSATAPPAT